MKPREEQVYAPKVHNNLARGLSLTLTDPTSLLSKITKTAKQCLRLANGGQQHEKLGWKKGA